MTAVDVLVAAGGLFFLAAAWWMRTHEFWSTRDARELAEDDPSLLRVVNYRVEVALTRWIVPIALAAFGIASLISAVVQ